MIKLLFFARLREALQTGSETLDFSPELDSVAAIIELLQARGGIWAELFADDQRVLVAVNQEMCDLEMSVKEGDEVAFFPPVTGG